MTDETFAGARWWKFDFHAHTPASPDYGKGSNQARLMSRSPTEWLLDFMRAGIDCVAVTDHNTGKWINELREAYELLTKEPPEGFRPLHLFPGTEIHVHGGVHLLGLLDPDKSTADIDRLLGAAGLPEDASHESVTTKSTVEVARVIHERGGLAIPAHVDGPRGVLTELGGPSLKAVRECPHIFAAEAKDRDALGERAGWSAVLGSDCHHPSGGDGESYPGSHFTWVKMGRPSLEGLRLALLDGDPLSIRRSDEAGEEDPNKHGSNTIESVTIHRARYAGLSEPLEGRFSPWLSALVGGRGTGKSTVVESLRLAFRRDDDLPEEIRKEFDAFARVPFSRDDGGALREETEVLATVRKDNARFRLRWREDGEGASIEEEDADGAWTESPGHVRDRFPVRILSQKQVLALSRDPNALLRIIDDSPEVNRTERDARRDAVEARFLRLRGEIREADSKIAERMRLSGELADLSRKIRAFEEGGHRERLLAYRRYRRQGQIFGDRREELESAERRLLDLADDLEPSDIREDEFDLSDQGDTSALDFLRQAAAEQRAYRERIGELAREFKRFREEWAQRVSTSSWAERGKEVTEAYASLKERLKSKGVEDIGAYGPLVQRRHLIQKRLSELDALVERRESISAEAESTLGRIEDARVELTRRRIAFCERVLSGNELVKVTVVPFGDDPSAAEKEFRTRLNREDGGLGKDILSEDGESGLLSELYRSEWTTSSCGGRKTVCGSSTAGPKIPVSWPLTKVHPDRSRPPSSPSSSRTGTSPSYSTSPRTTSTTMSSMT